jgi:hypothetical protein
LIQVNTPCTTSLEISREIKLLADTMSRSVKARRFAEQIKQLSTIAQKMHVENGKVPNQKQRQYISLYLSQLAEINRGQDTAVDKTLKSLISKLGSAATPAVATPITMEPKPAKQRQTLHAHPESLYRKPLDQRTESPDDMTSLDSEAPRDTLAVKSEFEKKIELKLQKA